MDVVVSGARVAMSGSSNGITSACRFSAQSSADSLIVIAILAAGVREGAPRISSKSARARTRSPVSSVRAKARGAREVNTSRVTRPATPPFATVRKIVSPMSKRDASAIASVATPALMLTSPIALRVNTVQRIRVGSGLEERLTWPPYINRAGRSAPKMTTAIFAAANRGIGSARATPRASRSACSTPAGCRRQWQKRCATTSTIASIGGARFRRRHPIVSAHTSLSMGPQSISDTETFSISQTRRLDAQRRRGHSCGSASAWRLVRPRAREPIPRDRSTRRMEAALVTAARGFNARSCNPNG
jgi:hypothetical protein